MKSRIISLCFCILALAISTVMTAKLINSQDYEPPVMTPSVKDPEVTPGGEKDPTPAQQVDLSEKAISSFSKKVEAFVERLAYDKDKNADDIDYIIENLDRISSHVLSAEVGDNKGAQYLSVLSNIFKSARDGFSSDAEFSRKVSLALSSLDEYQPDSEAIIYPAIDTSVGGSLTLALLSLYEENIMSDDTDTFTVTVGGSALLGDKLGTPDVDKFSKNLEKYTYPYPFHAISSVTAHDDMTLISLEAPLTTATDSQSTNPAKGSPDYATRLMGVDFVSLASSSVMEYGEAGLQDTVRALKENGISYSVQEGSGVVLTDFGKVVVITFDLTETPVTDEQATRNLEVVRNAVVAERDNGADLIIVQLHWNTRQRKTDALVSDYLGNTVSEYEAHFDLYNKEIARAAIGDGVTGADLVVGYSSRVAQGIELYRGKYIVYETGDLSFSGNVDREQKNTEKAFLFRQTFKKDTSGVKSVSTRIIPIINTTEEDKYLPQIVFDERADEIIDNIIYQSRYFADAIEEFNYIKIEK